MEDKILSREAWFTPQIRDLFDGDRTPNQWTDDEVSVMAEPIANGSADIGYVVYLGSLLATRYSALRAELQEAQQEVERRRIRQKDGNDWALATFGEATIESTMRRIDQELREFYEDPVGEAKDIAIFLYRLMSVAGKDLDAEVDAKMEINRARTWVLSGDGCGQHTGSMAKKGLMEEILELRAELAKERETSRDRFAQMALDEKVSGETGSPEDEAYNRACEDICAAIRGARLIAKGGE